MLALHVGRVMIHSPYSSKPKSGRSATQKRRMCLMCCKLFISAWQGERICPDCKQSSTWRNGESWLPGERRNDR